MEFLKRLGVTVPPGVRVEPPTAAEATARLTELNQLRLDVEARLLEAAAGPSPRFSARSVLPVDATGTGPGITAAIGAYITARAGTTIDPDEFRLFVALAHAFADGASALPPAVAWVRRFSDHLAVDSSAGVLLLHVCVAGARALLFPDTVPADVNSTSLLRVFFAGLPAAPAGGSPVSLVEWARRYAATSAETRRGFVQPSVAPISTLFQEAGSPLIAADVENQTWPSPVPLLELDGRSAVEAACARLEAASDPTETVSALRHLVLLVRHHSVADNRSPLRAARDRALPAVFSAGAELAAAPTASFRRSAVVSAVRDTVVPTLTSVHSFDAEPDDSTVPAPFALFLPRILRLDSRSELAYERCCGAISAAESGEPVDLAAVPVGSLGLICHLLDTTPASTTAGLRRRFRLGSTNPSARLVEAIGEARGARVRVVPSPVYGAIATVISLAGLEKTVSLTVDRFLGELSGVVVDFTQASERARVVRPSRSDTDPPVDERPIPTAADNGGNSSGGSGGEEGSTFWDRFNTTLHNGANFAEANLDNWFGDYDWADMASYLLYLAAFLFFVYTARTKQSRTFLTLVNVVAMAIFLVLFTASLGSLTKSSGPSDDVYITAYKRGSGNNTVAGSDTTSFKCTDIKWFLHFILTILSIPAAKIDKSGRIKNLVIYAAVGLSLLNLQGAQHSDLTKLVDFFRVGYGKVMFSITWTKEFLTNVVDNGEIITAFTASSTGIYAYYGWAIPNPYAVAAYAVVAAVVVSQTALFGIGYVEGEYSTEINDFYATQAVPGALSLIKQSWIPFALTAISTALSQLLVDRDIDVGAFADLEAMRRAYRDLRAFMLVYQASIENIASDAYSVRFKTEKENLEKLYFSPNGTKITDPIWRDNKFKITPKATSEFQAQIRRLPLEYGFTPVKVATVATMVLFVLHRLMTPIRPTGSFSNKAVVEQIKARFKAELDGTTETTITNIVGIVWTKARSKDFKERYTKTPLSRKSKLLDQEKEKLEKWVKQTLGDILTAVMDNVDFDGLETTLNTYRQLNGSSVSVRSPGDTSQIANRDENIEAYFQLNLSKTIAADLFVALSTKIIAFVKTHWNVLTIPEESRLDVKDALGEVKADSVTSELTQELLKTVFPLDRSADARVGETAAARVREAIATVQSKIVFKYTNAADSKNLGKANEAWWYAGISDNPAQVPSRLAWRVLGRVVDAAPGIAALAGKYYSGEAWTQEDMMLFVSLIGDYGASLSL